VSVVQFVRSNPFLDKIVFLRRFALALLETIPISMRSLVFVFFVLFTLLLAPEAGLCASPNAKLVVRIETVSATLKGGALVVHVVGMGRTPAIMKVPGQLQRRGQKQQPNKDGLMEYELYYVPPANYSGDALKPVKATLRESNIPPGTKGVMIYGEFNEKSVMLPTQKEKPARTKKKEEGFTEQTPKQEPPPKPEPKIEAPKKQEQVVKKQEATPKKPDVTVEKKESRGWNLNPFHHKPTPTPSPVLKKIPPAKPAPVAVKEKEPKKEEQVIKKEETVPKKEEAKKKTSSWNLNPFRRKLTPAPEISTPAPESKKPGPVVQQERITKKKEPEPVQKPALKKEQTKPRPEEKKKESRGWNLNPFHRKARSAPEGSPPVPELRKPEPAAKKEQPPQPESPKPKPTAKKEEQVTKKEEPAAKKEEAKKKSRWKALNPLNWNPFGHKSTEPAPDQ
jgi:hypothetical protein